MRITASKQQGEELEASREGFWGKAGCGILYEKL